MGVELEQAFADLWDGCRQGRETGHCMQRDGDREGWRATNNKQCVLRRVKPKLLGSKEGHSARWASQP